MLTTPDRLEQPVTNHLHTDIAVFDQELTVGQVLETLRATGLREQILYLYVTGEGGKLAGVVPTRRLLVAQPETRLHEIMVARVVTLPRTATVFDACDLFITHRFLALPVVDENKRLLGVVDVSLLTEEVFDAAERREAEEVFQFIGVRMSELQKARSPLVALRYRTPWLFATLAGGLACAVIASFFEATVQQSVTLAIFFAMALGLGESVAIQSMTLTLQHLHARSSDDLRQKATRELITAVMIGLLFGFVVMVIGAVWRRDPVVVSIGVSIAIAITVASIIGLLVPILVRKMGRDPEVAAGPIALALADAATSLAYFGIASLVL